jgi:hypothetical protein
MPSRAVSDPDGFVKVQTIRYKPQPLPNQNSKKNRRNKRQEPEAHLASASDRLASLRDAVQAKTLTLTDGSWGTAWLGKPLDAIVSGVVYQTHELNALLIRPHLRPQPSFPIHLARSGRTALFSNPNPSFA